MQTFSKSPFRVFNRDSVCINFASKLSWLISADQTVQRVGSIKMWYKIVESLNRQDFYDLESGGISNYKEMYVSKLKPIVLAFVPEVTKLFVKNQERIHFAKNKRDE